MSTPKITVLMPVYNGEKYLKEAIASILSQTYTDFEFLIIDDGSRDSTVSIIESYKDERIRLVNNEKNIGIVDTLNKGIELAKGEYIARMDCDDISLPQRLEKEVEILEKNKDVSLVASHFILVDERGLNTGFWPPGIKVKTNEEIHEILPRENCIAHPTVLIRRDILMRYKYKKNQQGVEDWDLWLRMASDKLVFYKVNEVLLKYRIHNASATIIRDQKGVYINRCEVFGRYCLSRKFQFNKFDLRVLKSCLFNYFNHILFLIGEDIPDVWSALLGNKITKVVSQLNSLFTLSYTKSVSIFLFMPYCGTKEHNYKYFRFLEFLQKEKTLVFTTVKSEGHVPDKNVIDISAVAEFPYICKLVKRMITKRIRNSSNAIVIGYDNTFFYSLMAYIGENVRCMDIVEANMSIDEPNYKLIYNYGIWGMPYVSRLPQRIVIGKETYEELKQVYSNAGLNESFKKVELVNDIKEMNKIITHG